MTSKTPNDPLRPKAQAQFGEDRCNFFESGMNDFVTKPVDPAALYAALIK